MRSRSSASSGRRDAGFLRPRAALVAGALVSLLVIAGGCGEVSEAEFRSDAEAICKRTDAEVSRIPAPPANDLAANGRHRSQVLAIFRRAHQRLKAVDAPSKRRSEYKKWVGTIERISRLIDVQAKAANAGDRRVFDALVQQQNAALQESKAQTALLGLRQC